MEILNDDFRNCCINWLLCSRIEFDSIKYTTQIKKDIIAKFSLGEKDIEKNMFQQLTISLFIIWFTRS
jgi:hypothetical protein